MDITELKADLEKRQKEIVEKMNKNISQRQQLEAEMQELVREAERLNGEGRLLNRLNGDKPDKPT
jgi:hypothetical protein